MRTTLLRPHIAAAPLVSAASLVCGQSCIWTQPGFTVSPTSPVAYHSGLHRVIQLQVSYHVAANLWGWDGSSWVQLASNGPTRRGAPGVAYDSARNRLIVFGGVLTNPNFVYLGDTWEWDGTVWAQAAASGPPPRSSPNLVYDTARARTVLFGGYTDATGWLQDTWEWDGGVWSLMANYGPGRNAGPMAYDSARNHAILYDGSAAGADPSIWEWNGAHWLARPTSGGPRGGIFWMIFDPGRSRMICSQYPPASGGLPGMWELDTAAATWDFRVPGASPIGPAAFDVSRSRGVALWNDRVWEYNSAGTGVAPYITGQPVGGSYPLGAVVELSVQALGTSLHYQWRRGGVVLVDGGSISGATSDTLTIDPAAAGDTGSYDVVISNICSVVLSDPAFVQVGPPPCYANCDRSTTPPFLTINDFACFINRFAAGDSYANCDNSSPPPPLNVQDFVCFLNMFAAGCSSP
jgi:hypothetical protein